MKKLLQLSLLFFGTVCLAQNDLDAIRYSRLGFGGSARFTSMGGAFGALGADMSCATTNPGALGLFTKGELNLGLGLKFVHNKADLYGKSNTQSDANFVFNNFGIMLCWKAENDNESRHIFGFTNNQLQNFNSKTRLTNYTNSNSITRDMLNKTEGITNPEKLNYSYEGAAFNVYVLDTFKGKYISFVDPYRTVLQTRDIVTQGKVNDLNISYAYAWKDKFYFGASVGLPRVTYSSTTTHSEVDDKDSMRVDRQITGTDTTYSNTYKNGLPNSAFYTDKLGFNSLVYKEFFATQGNGVNLKLGGVFRVSDELRFGFYYHSPTIYTMKDVYYNSMNATFDANPKGEIEYKYPEGGGYYDYKIITPPKYGLSTGIVVAKQVAIGMDYELIDYKKAQLSSKNISDFNGVNTVIKNKYTVGHNVRAGVEVNVKPVLIRAGYMMQGSPFGQTFNGKFVRNTFSLGCGFRGKNNFYLDLCWNKSFTKEDYFMFTTITQQSTINSSSASFNATVGLKF
jgi:hypothetical protein